MYGTNIYWMFFIFTSTMPIWAQTLNCATKWKRMHECKIYFTQQISILKRHDHFPPCQYWMILTVTKKIKCIKETKVSFLLYMCVKFFFSKFYGVWYALFTKHLKNYALWIFFPICVTFGIKSTHFVKKNPHIFSNRVIVSVNVNKLL